MFVTDWSEEWIALVEFWSRYCPIVTKKEKRNSQNDENNFYSDLKLINAFEMYSKFLNRVYSNMVKKTQNMHSMKSIK